MCRHIVVLTSYTSDAAQRRALIELHKRIKELPYHAAHYSDPRCVVELPFPSTNVVPPCFAVNTSSTFKYMGREKFTLVWDTWLKIKADTWHRQAIYVFGTGGYSKSHILATLACLLIHSNERVVYLPDCRAMFSQPLLYLRNALLFAFAGSEFCDYGRRIWECQNIEALGDFCQQYECEGGKLCFIIDQQNALYLDPEGQDAITDEEKSALGSLLRRVACGHVGIWGASANQNTAAKFRYWRAKDCFARRHDKGKDSKKNHNINR